MNATLTRLTAGALVIAALAVAGCGSSGDEVAVPGGDASDGGKLIAAYGCGSCHDVAGVDGATGRVGPPLDDFAERRLIAGRVPNTLENLLRWLRNPQAVEPGTVMPDLDLGELQARDIAAYLYSH